MSGSGTPRRLWRALVRAWPWLRFVVGLAVAGLALWVLAGRRDELNELSTILLNVRWWWVLPAAMVEIGSLAAFAEVQYRLLEAGGTRVSFPPLLGMTFAAQAMNDSLPAGAVFSTVYAFRWYRRLGAGQKLAVWALVGTLVTAGVSLALVATGGVALATEQGANQGLIGVVIGVLVVTVAAGAVLVSERPLIAVVHWGVRACRRVTGRPRGDVDALVDRIVSWITVVRLRRRDVVAVVLWGMSNWLLDCGCLVCSFLAVGAPVPWGGLLLAYGAGQLAANLPITPGGLGAVEGSITIALVAFGGGRTDTVAAVLLYRIISFWAELPVGWSIWGILAWGVRRGRWPQSPLLGHDADQSDDRSRELGVET